MAFFWLHSVNIILHVWEQWQAMNVCVAHLPMNACVAQIFGAWTEKVGHACPTFMAHPTRVGRKVGALHKKFGHPCATVYLLKKKTHLDSFCTSCWLSYYFRETCKRMASENERLHSLLFQTEKDTIEVVTYLKQGDIEKEENVCRFLQF